MFRWSTIRSFNPGEYLSKHLTPRSAKILLALLAGFSLSILAAGYFFQRRHRRYRARAIRTTSTSHSLYRSNTFQTHSRHSSFQQNPHRASHYTFKSNDVSVSTSSPEVSSPSLQSGMVEEPLPQPDVFQMDTDGGGEEEEEEEEESNRRTSSSSNDSFHSTLAQFDSDPMFLSSHNQLYHSALELVTSGGVKCRKIRAELLHCLNEQDFLAKVHCVRLAMDGLLQSPSTRNYFVEVGRNVMAGFLQDTNQDPTLFVTRFNALVVHMENSTNWEIAKKELVAREVVCMNIYDIALDFILLDAFDDLDNPPSTIVAVLQNKWITTGMKTAALSAAIWSISKAKKSMLKHKNGFMAQFYSLSETISPTLAWGFLGTDENLKTKCAQFRDSIENFTRSIFSLEKVRYTTVASLSDDILRLAQQAAQSLDTS